MKDHWTKCYERYLFIRRLVVTGKIDLEDRFTLDPDDPDSPVGTLQQLMEVLGLQRKFGRLRRWLINHGRYVDATATPVQQRKYKLSEHTRELNRERQRRFRERRSS